MPDTEEILKNMEEPENARENKWRFFLQYLLSPALVVLLGAGLSWWTGRTQARIQGVEVAQHMLPELFSDDPDEALAAEKMVNAVVDPALGQAIREIVTNRLARQAAVGIASGDTITVAKIVNAAQSSGSSVGSAIVDSVRREWKGIDTVVQRVNVAQEQEKIGYKRLEQNDLAGAAKQLAQTAPRSSGGN